MGMSLWSGLASLKLDGVSEFAVRLAEQAGQWIQGNVLLYIVTYKHALDLPFLRGPHGRVPTRIHHAVSMSSAFAPSSCAPLDETVGISNIS
jgi:hypothetical protein